MFGPYISLSGLLLWAFGVCQCRHEREARDTVTRLSSQLVDPQSMVELGGLKLLSAVDIIGC